MALYDIIETETRYINQELSQVQVSFLLPSPDWCILKNSSEWHRVEEIIQEFQNKHIQRSHQVLE